MTREADRMSRLLQKANDLPFCPGVYIMRDARGKVIYVGKSRKLKSRVSQYFQNSEKNIKTARMVASVEDFDCYICDTEIEALSLENTLIKQYAPKYNIRLKDAKSYPYIKITDEEYPRLVFTRKREKDKARYYGPYSGSGTAYSLIELLSRTLRLPTCSRRFPKEIGRERPCIYYQMGRCSGLCTGKITPEEHKATMRLAAELLGGKVKDVKREIEAEMYAHAEAERYEQAAKCRDTLTALDRISERQKVVASPDTDQDVIAFYADELCACISVFYIRAGVLQDKNDFLFGADALPEPEEITAFLCRHYAMREDIPSRVLLAFSTDEEEIATLGEYLHHHSGHRVHVRVPERGELHTLCDMAQKNAAEQARLFVAQTNRTEGTLVRLSEMLSLECYPTRIEAYDISNIGSEHLTAGMIVCEDGKFKKSDYRTFRIGSVEGTDDYASMREALDRRLSHLSDDEGSFSNLPDLILLDGGRGHVSTVRALLEEKGLDIPVFGMVKDDYHKTRALCTETEEISIARVQDVFSLIYRIQEEVHRYTVGRMTQAKRKTVRTSSLTKIPGIGDAKAKKLLSAFGGLAALKKATREQIAAVSGISEKNADDIIAYFRK